MNIGFIQSYFKKIYLEFKDPRNIQIKKQGDQYVIKYHKWSTEELNKRVPPILFILFGFIVIPLANIEEIVFRFILENKKFFEMIFGLLVIFFLLGYFYLIYRFIIHGVFGKIVLMFSNDNLKIDQDYLGIKRIDTLIIPKKEIEKVEIIRCWEMLWRPALYLFYPKGKLQLMVDRSKADMIFLKEILDNFLNKNE